MKYIIVLILGGCCSPQFGYSKTATKLHCLFHDGLKEGTDTNFLCNDGTEWFYGPRSECYIETTDSRFKRISP